MARTGIDILKAAGSPELPMPPCARLLGWELLEIEPGRVKARYQASEQFLNPQGVVQGGFVAAMLDDVMGPAAFSLLDEGQFTPTLEFKISFMRPVKPGPVIGEGRVIDRTKSTVFMEGELRDESGALLARGSATARIVNADLPELRR
jgi:uncharacterized protein (TIGR00369 family)